MAASVRDIVTLNGEDPVADTALLHKGAALVTTNPFEEAWLAVQKHLLGLDWTPERIDWRHYWLEIHCAGLERWVFPEIEAKTRKPRRHPRAYPKLASLLAALVNQFGHAPAIIDITRGAEERLTFVELSDLAARRARARGADEPIPSWITARSSDALAFLDAALSLEVSGLSDVRPDRAMVAFTESRAPLDAFVLARALSDAPTRATVILARETKLPAALDRAARFFEGIRRVPSSEIGAALIEALDRGRSVGLVLAGPAAGVLSSIEGRAISIVPVTIEGSAEAWPAGSEWPRRGTVRVRLG